MYNNCSLRPKASSPHQLLMVGIFQNDVVSIGLQWAAADLIVTLMGVVKAMAECHHHLHEIMATQY